jgi:hypothetical protein
MNQFAKRYQLWQLADQKNERYTVSEFDSLEECVAAPKGSNDWYITKKVSLSVTDAADQPVPFAIPNNQPLNKSDEGKKSSKPEPAEQLPRKYEEGTVATPTNSVIA